MKRSLLEYQQKLFPEMIVPAEEPEPVKNEPEVDYIDSDEDWDLKIRNINRSSRDLICQVTANFIISVC